MTLDSRGMSTDTAAMIFSRSGVSWELQHKTADTAAMLLSRSVVSWELQHKTAVVISLFTFKTTSSVVFPEVTVRLCDMETDVFRTVSYQNAEDVVNSFRDSDSSFV